MVADETYCYHFQYKKVLIILDTFVGIWFFGGYLYIKDVETSRSVFVSGDYQYLYSA